MGGLNLMTSGIYTVSEAAFLVGATQQQIRGWVSGYPRRKLPPLIQNELGTLDDRIALSFTNLMELRFIAFFVNAGVHVWHIRAIMDDVRDLLNHPHPFATQQVFRTDGRKIVAEIGFKHSGKQIYDLRSKNYEMRSVVLETLKDDVIYDAEGVARAWYPRRHFAPNVIMHPRFAFGHPILRDSRIPTRALASAVAAEGSVRSVAEWYEVPESQVREAVWFETALRKAA